MSVNMESFRRISKSKKTIVIICLIILAIAVYFLNQKYIVGKSEKGILFVKRAYAGMPLVLEYRHSVQRTMIYENLEIDGNVSGLVLKSTKYQSYGAGLPFLQTDGHFRKEKDWFVLDSINRKYPVLSIRNGVTNEEKIHVGNSVYNLKDEMPIGTKLDICVVPLYKVCFL